MIDEGLREEICFASMKNIKFLYFLKFKKMKFFIKIKK
ncbi:hypothetical protein C414_000260066 [Campylobacter jejuni subsp. jejuni 414]|nr:hypothetical protein C414_000260066 [Campylobacter jejuni subsp. jejuni 414]